MPETDVLLKVNHLYKNFGVPSKKLFEKAKTIKAVNDVTLSVHKGETLGIVGESGCGKSTLGRTMIKLLNPSSGSISFDGNDITNLSEKEMRQYRKDLQIIFQDPYASLNPRMTVEETLSDSLTIQGMYPDKKERVEYILKVMNECGLSEDYLRRYPHEFSGGQRQRIGIARALCLKPRLIICDEPVSSLDVSIQSQILNLLTNLREEHNLTLVFISHNLSVINFISDRVAVMYLGKIVEVAEKEELYNHPYHPYTKALLAAVPRIGEGKFDPKRSVLEGTIPSPIDLPKGCIFSDRCPVAREECKTTPVSLEEISSGHFAACRYI